MGHTRFSGVHPTGAPGNHFTKCVLAHNPYFGTQIELRIREKRWAGQVMVSHIPRELSCHDMCKIMIWLNHNFQKPSIVCSMDIGIIVPCHNVIYDPSCRAVLCCGWETCVHLDIIHYTNICLPSVSWHQQHCGSLSARYNTVLYNRILYTVQQIQGKTCITLCTIWRYPLVRPCRQTLGCLI